MKRKLPDPYWFRFLRVGDVLALGDVYRVVRHVARHSDGTLRNVAFTIRCRSWTRRCYTTYDATQLRRGARYVGARLKLDTELDRRIAEAIAQRSRPGKPPAGQLTWKDVQGVA